MSKYKGRKPQPQKRPCNMKDAAPPKSGGVYFW